MRCMLGRKRSHPGRFALVALLFLMQVACWTEPGDRVGQCLAYCEYLKRCNEARAGEVALCEGVCRNAEEPGSPYEMKDDYLACIEAPVSCAEFMACARAASPDGRVLGDPLPEPGEEEDTDVKETGR